MPRSGTTLVEQIISSHSQVTEQIKPRKTIWAMLMDLHQLAHVISEFRDNYLTEIEKLSKGNSIVIDKIPQNFLYS